MKIAIGADHAGYELKQFLVKQLASSGYEVLDLGTHDSAPVIIRTSPKRSAAR